MQDDSFKKVATVWAVATPVILLLAYPLADLAEQSYLMAVVALFGFLLLFTAWANGKGASVFAAELGLAGGAHVRDRVSSPPQPPSGAGAGADTIDPPIRAERNRLVILRKKKRSSGDVTSVGASWLGGLPALGNQPWPRDTTGQPMHHLAQIDLGDAAAKLKVPGLPTTGSLAFFTVAAADQDTTFETAVRYVPRPAEPTPAPADLPAAGDHTFGGPWAKGADAGTLQTFPRWAVELMPHITQGDGYALQNELDEMMPPDNGQLVSRESMQHLPNAAMPSYWDSAHRFVRSVEGALQSDQIIEHHERRAAAWEDDLASFEVAGVRPGADPDAMRQSITEWRQKAAHMRAIRPELLTKTQQMREWAFANEPWAVMSDADLAEFAQLFLPFSLREKDADEQLFYRHSGYSFNSLEDIARETFTAMITGSVEVYERLPESVRRDVDVSALATSPAHQMFGPGYPIQTAAFENEHNHLLLQLACDSLLGMGWGDAGAIQFWISAPDLAAQNWDQVEATFESH